MNYRLEKIAENEHKSDAPQDRLRLFFSTHDVTLTGYRLHKLLDPLRSGRIESIRALPARYSNLRIEEAFVTEITIAPANQRE